MNERIKLLAIEATKYSNTLMIDYLDLSDEDYKEKYNQEYNKKFAELIVAECMQLNSKELSITAIERLLPMYREHFGVEE